MAEHPDPCSRRSRLGRRILAAAVLGVGIAGLMATSAQAALRQGPGQGEPRLENVSARCISGTAFEISGDVQGSGTDLKLFAEAPDGEPVGPDVPMTAGFGFIYQGDIGALPQPQFIELLLTSTDEVDVYDHDLPTIDWSQCDTAEPEPGEPDTGEPEPSEPEPSEPETGEPETGDAETGDADADADERPMLPATGPDSSTWMALSAGLALLSGTAMLAATRRRT